MLILKRVKKSLVCFLVYFGEMFPRGKVTQRSWSSVKDVRLLAFAVLAVLPALSFAQVPTTDLSMLVTRDSQNRSVVSFRMNYADEQGGLVASFFFDSPKGLLGPSNNPSDQSGFGNTEKTLFGVNYQPATKSSLVYLFSKTKAGDLLYIRDINPRVARLLPRRWSESVKGFLRIENILGRRVNLQAVDFSGNARQSFKFSINVGSGGSISLSK
jgi:hypothetical protein